jgi:hypothetical protein
MKRVAFFLNKVDFGGIERVVRAAFEKGNPEENVSKLRRRIKAFNRWR